MVSWCTAGLYSLQIYERQSAVLPARPHFVFGGGSFVSPGFTIQVHIYELVAISSEVFRVLAAYSMDTGSSADCIGFFFFFSFFPVYFFSSSLSYCFAFSTNGEAGYSFKFVGVKREWKAKKKEEDIHNIKGIRLVRNQSGRIFQKLWPDLPLEGSFCSEFGSVNTTRILSVYAHTVHFSVSVCLRSKSCALMRDGHDIRYRRERFQFVPRPEYSRWICAACPAQ